MVEGTKLQACIADFIQDCKNKGRFEGNPPEKQQQLYNWLEQDIQDFGQFLYEYKG